MMMFLLGGLSVFIVQAIGMGVMIWISATTERWTGMKHAPKGVARAVPRKS
jgi:hypothetical protein